MQNECFKTNVCLVLTFAQRWIHCTHTTRGITTDCLRHVCIAINAVIIKLAIVCEWKRTVIAVCDCNIKNKEKQIRLQTVALNEEVGEHQNPQQ